MQKVHGLDLVYGNDVRPDVVINCDVCDSKGLIVWLLESPLRDVHSYERMHAGVEVLPH